MRWILTIALLVCVATTAYAKDEVLLNGGGTVAGEVKSADMNGITVESEDGKTVQIAPADLDPHYYYEQWAKRIDKDAEAHLRLAVYAYQNGMFNQARSQYTKAERLDKDLVKKFEEEYVPRIKEGVAKQLLAIVDRAIDGEDWKTAKRVAAKILTDLEDTAAAEQARESIAHIHLWQLSKDEERFLKSIVKYLPKDEAKALQAQERVVKKMAPIENRLRKAQDLVTKGLRTKSTNRQKDTFKTAAKRFESIIKDLDKLKKDAAGDEALGAYIDEVRQTAVRDGVDAYVHAGSVYLIRRAYNDALEMANAALALDPDSQHAKSFYQRVLQGSQMRSGWWGRGR